MDIQFRLWHTKRKQYIEECVVELVNDGIYWSLKIPEHVIVEKTTCFQDKYKINIYEGDLVKYNDIVYRVFYCEINNNFRMVTADYDPKMWDQPLNGDNDYLGRRHHSCQIIGNIHEHSKFYKFD